MKSRAKGVSEILVVDDNHDGAMSLSTLLELNGHHTTKSRCDVAGSNAGWFCA
jgi:CheY-like chemotaxis protein